MENVIIIGGGFAGLNLVKRLDPDDMSITLVEGTGTLLGPMRPSSQKKALKYLGELLVDVRLNTMTSGYQDKMVSFSDGHKEYWETVIWTAGIRGETIPGLPQELLGHGGRILVDQYSRVPGYEESLYAIGDIALMKTPDYPRGHPQLAQPVIQQAACLARNFNDGSFSRVFRYHDKGSMATVGKNKAVADLPRFSFGGWFAWLAWMLVHLMSILGMRNKVNVLINWMWNYISYSTALRLLLRPTKYPVRRHWSD